MSKRKNRRKPLTSEIQSVMRAPTDLDSDAVDGGAEDQESGAERQERDAQGQESEPEPNAALGAESSLESSPDSQAAADPVGANEAQAELGATAEPEAEPRGRAAKKRPRRADASVQLHAVSASAEEPTASAADYFEALDRAELSGPVEEDEPSEPRFEPIAGADTDDTEGFLRGLIEALLFTSQRPLALKDIARSAGLDRPRAQELLDQLIQDYAPRGLCIEEVAGGFVMRSSARYAPYIQKLLALRPIRLSRAQLETLAIIAYRQPVTKPEVDDIRGVDSGQVIKGLLDRALLKIMGKKDEPGRPMLYGTTNDFLELLNLQSLKDLPTLREYTELSEESQRKFMEETGEAAPSGAAAMGTATFEGTPLQGTDQAGSVSESSVAPETSDLAEHERDALDATAPQAQSSDPLETASNRSEPAAIEGAGHEGTELGPDEGVSEGGELASDHGDREGQHSTGELDARDKAAPESLDLADVDEGQELTASVAENTDIDPAANGDADEESWQQAGSFADDMRDVEDEPERSGAPPPADTASAEDDAAEAEALGRSVSVDDPGNDLASGSAPDTD
jgi:segregation and condensation protein B